MEKTRVVNFITDFGLEESFVAQMKGVFLQSNLPLQLVDTTHLIPPGDIWTAGFHLWSCWKAFPPKTLHVVVVDPTVGSERRILLVKLKNQFILCPDNGIITFLQGQWEKLWSLSPPPSLKPISQTFHGRDIFAPLGVAFLQEKPLDKKPLSNPILLDYQPPRKNPQGWEGRMLHSDRFGNIITDLPVEKEAGEVIIQSHRINRWVKSFFEGPPNTPILCRGSCGTLEIAINRGRAIDQIPLQKGDTIVWRFP